MSHRFEPRYGPLRSVVPRAAEAFLECGRLQNGFARGLLERDRLERLARYVLGALARQVPPIPPGLTGLIAPTPRPGPDQTGATVRR